MPLCKCQLGIIGLLLPGVLIGSLAGSQISNNVLAGRLHSQSPMSFDQRQRKKGSSKCRCSVQPTAACGLHACSTMEQRLETMKLCLDSDASPRQTELHCTVLATIPGGYQPLGFEDTAAGGGS